MAVQDNPFPCLPIECVIKDRYVIGPKIYGNGESQMYLSYDLHKRERVTVKEYFPDALCDRDPKTLNVVPSIENLALFKTYMYEFAELNKKLVELFADKAGENFCIRHIREVFTENATCYVVSEYIDGITLKMFLSNAGGAISWEQVKEIFPPLLSSLGQLHSHDIIHRNINPSNIIVTERGEGRSCLQMRLVNFGISAAHTKGGALNLATSPGYSAPELYSTVAKQGTWTDVYGICAVLYFALTGQIPEPAKERERKEEIAADGGTVRGLMIAPRLLNINIPEYVSDAIMAGLALKRERRLRDVTELVDYLWGNVPAIRRIEKQIEFEQRGAAAGGDRQESPQRKSPPRRAEYERIYDDYNGRTDGADSDTEGYVPDVEHNFDDEYDSGGVDDKAVDFTNYLKSESKDDGGYFNFKKNISKGKAKSRGNGNVKVGSDRNAGRKGKVGSGKNTGGNVKSLRKEEAAQSLPPKVSKARQPYENYNDNTKSIKKQKNTKQMNDEKDNTKKSLAPLFLGALGVVTFVTIILVVIFSSNPDILVSETTSETVTEATSAEETSEVSSATTAADTTSARPSGVGDYVVPMLVGLEYRPLTENPAYSDYLIKPTYEYNDAVPKGFIVSQYPSEDSFIDYMGEIYVVISNGPSGVLLPDYTGYTVDDYCRKLSDLGIKYEKKEQMSTDLPPNTVLGTDPQPGMRVDLANTTATVTVYYAVAPPPVTTETTEAITEETTEDYVPPFSSDDIQE